MFNVILFSIIGLIVISLLSVSSFLIYFITKLADESQIMDEEEILIMSRRNLIK